MFNQEMQNAQESAGAETPAELKRKCSSIFRSLHFCSPWTADTPTQRTGTAHATEKCKNSWLPSLPDCARYRYYSSAEPLYESYNNNIRERRKALKSRQRENLMILSAERPTSFNIS